MIIKKKTINEVLNIKDNNLVKKSISIKINENQLKNLIKIYK